MIVYLKFSDGIGDFLIPGKTLENPLVLEKWSTSFGYGDLFYARSADFVRRSEVMLPRVVVRDGIGLHLKVADLGPYWCTQQCSEYIVLYAISLHDLIRRQCNKCGKQ